MTIEEISIKMYDQFILERKIDIKVYEVHIKKNDKKDFIQYQIRYGEHYFTHLFLNNPDLIASLAIDDWQYIMEYNINNTSSLIALITFLNNYIGINSLELFLQLEVSNDRISNDVISYYKHYINVLSVKKRECDEWYDRKKIGLIRIKLVGEGANIALSKVDLVRFLKKNR